MSINKELQSLFDAEKDGGLSMLPQALLYSGVRAAAREIESLQKQLQGIGVEQYYALQDKCREQGAEIESLRLDNAVLQNALKIAVNRNVELEGERDEARQALAESIKDESRQESIFNTELRQANAALLKCLRWYAEHAEEVARAYYFGQTRSSIGGYAKNILDRYDSGWQGKCPICEDTRRTVRYGREELGEPHLVYQDCYRCVGKDTAQPTAQGEEESE